MEFHFQFRAFGCNLSHTHRVLGCVPRFLRDGDEPFCGSTTGGEPSVPTPQNE